ncbi:uncharacterized protein LOC115883731 [Sitophilus oryzae]|uniref:Uncharacterized protein LOC115883731 n=1 Tax=Sitophilus oryzae TaxID=7048 RepID=A0A6J2Y4T7_SITOR|nr:uncharacterized protein LOC115883731 [Sitophilus oryzae]
MYPRFIKVFLLFVAYEIVFRNQACAAYQSYFLDKNGEYKYEYGTENGIYAKQQGDVRNEVTGQYGTRNYGIKYTAGVRGYVPHYTYYNNFYNPEVTHSVQPNYYHQDQFANLGGISSQSAVSGQLDFGLYAPNYYFYKDNTFEHLPFYKEVPYAFEFDTGNYKRQESRDSNGNVRGFYYYRDDAGIHDLTYTASKRDGFIVTGGNLAVSFIPTIGPYPSTTGSVSNPVKPFEKASTPQPSGSTEGDVVFLAGVTEPSTDIQK